MQNSVVCKTFLKSAASAATMDEAKGNHPNQECCLLQVASSTRSYDSGQHHTTILACTAQHKLHLRPYIQAQFNPSSIYKAFKPADDVD